jgi:hypothetical protein
VTGSGDVTTAAGGVPAITTLDGTLRPDNRRGKKYVVSSTLERVDWNAELVHGDLGKA